MSASGPRHLLQQGTKFNARHDAPNAGLETKWGLHAFSVVLRKCVPCPVITLTPKTAKPSSKTKRLARRLAQTAYCQFFLMAGVQSASIDLYPRLDSNDGDRWQSGSGWSCRSGNG
jgi:hypothetical protein